MEKISRQQAKAAGLTHYFTGVPCARGHIAPRFTSIAKCKECTREDAMRAYKHTTNKRRSYSDQKSFIEAATLKFTGYYSYKKAKYVNAHTPLTITCPKHGEFQQSPTNHIQGKGCPLCGTLQMVAKQSGSTSDFIFKAKGVWGDRWDYTKAVYEKSHKKVVITCPTHGDFEQTPTNHLTGKVACSPCNHMKSQQEDAIYKFMSIFTKAEARNRTLVAPKELDIYLPEHNLAIEYCGMYWHSHTDKEDEKANKHKHYDKYKAAQTQGVRVVTMYESEWLERSHVLKRLLRAAIGKMKGRIMARKCEVRKVGPKEAKAFFEKYHPQGGAGGGSNYALFYKEKMVACMRFSFGINDRGVGAKNSTWTLSRYATRLPVAGGASKLFKAFLKEERPIEVKSFSDNRYFSGAMYRALGFSLDQETLPDYQVWSKILGLKPKSHYQRRALPQRIIEHQVPIVFDPDHSPQTEQDITYAVGARRIYDCGKKKWVFIDKPTG